MKLIRISLALLLLFIARGLTLISIWVMPGLKGGKTHGQ